MWFKQNEQKSPQQPETSAPRPQPAVSVSVAPLHPADSPPLSAPVATPAPATNSSRITAGLSLKGEIAGREDLWIGGTVDGKLRLDSARVIVGPSGKVHGEIEAREVVIEGIVEGNLHAAERLEIAASGAVRGDASAPRVSIQDGAAFNGAMEILRDGESRSLPQHHAAAPPRASGSPRVSRFQTAQAAGAAASSGASTSPAGAASVAPEKRDGDSAAAPTVLLRGIAADSSEQPE